MKHFVNSQKNPLFSVVIPLYNKEAHIIRTLESVLNQSCQEFELIIVDDGSTDDGVAVVNAFFNEPGNIEKYGHTSVQIIRQDNAGVSVARNRGVEESEGMVIAFIDADDTWEPHFLAEVSALKLRFPDSRAYGTGYQFIVDEQSYVDPKIRFSRPAYSPRILDDYFEVGARGALPFTMSSFCIERTLFNELGGFPVGEAMGEDQDLFCKTALATDIAYSPSVLSFYHHDAQNRACGQIIPDKECGFSKRLNDLVEGHKTKPVVSESALNYCAAHLLHIASLNVRAGRLAVAKRILADDRCKRLAPRYLKWMTLSVLLSVCGTVFGSVLSGRRAVGS